MMPSRVFMFVSVGFVSLPSEDISTPLEKLLAPFSLNLWLCTCLLYLCAICTIIATKGLQSRQRHFIIGGRNNNTPVLNMWNTFLGGAIGNPRFGQQRYLGTFARSLLIIWLLGCLVIRSSYQGALYDFMQRPRLGNLYDTIDKINRSKCKLIVMDSSIKSIDYYNFDERRLV